MIRMLQSAGPTLKIVLGSLLVIICASMVITLIPGVSSSGLGGGTTERGVIAQIGDEKVSAMEVQREARAMVRQQFPKGGPEMATLLPFFMSQAAEQLINEKALVAEARRLGLQASDDDLRDEMQHGPLAATLFPDGKFVGDAQYEDFVQRNNLTIPQFENLEKDYILIRKLRALISGGAAVSDAEVRQEFDRRNTKVKFDYAVLTQQDILKGLHPTDQELKAYYDEHKASYNNAIPEKRQIKYVFVDSAKITAETQVTDQDLQAYYDQHRDEYRVPEQVKVSHILIKTPLAQPGAKVDEKAVDEARKKAEDVLKQVKAGGDFAKLAEKYSDDPGSAKQGGELGWIGRGRTVPEFEKAAFTVAKGQTSDLVKSSYGFHIIHVEDKQDAHMKLLPEVKSEIEQKVKQDKAARASEAAANLLLSAARKDGIDKAAEAKGYKVVATDYFGRSDALPGPGSAPQFIDAVFNEQEKAPPDVVQTPQGYVVFTLMGVRPPATPTFDEIRSRVDNEFRNERASVLLQQKTRELSDRAKADHDLKKAAKELGASIKTSELVLPDGQVPDVGSMSGSASVIFSLKQGEISGPIVTGPNGVVARLIDKQQPTEQDFASKKSDVREELLQSKQQQIFGMFVSNLRSEMEKSKRLKINQEEMKQLTRRGTDEGL